jgi:hypothetical protein
MTTDTLSAAVAHILANADADIAAHKPACRNSGRCCRFEEYGHRLYVTSAELLHFAHTHVAPPASCPLPAPTHAISLPQFFSSDAPRGCPYQIDNLCTAREARPLGCRVYFCDASAQSWQNELYEKYHSQLVALHDQFQLSYCYLEWRAALRELMQSPQG